MLEDALGDGEDDAVRGAHQLLAQVFALRRDRGRSGPVREVEGEAVAVESFVSEKHVSLRRVAGGVRDRVRVRGSWPCTWLVTVHVARDPVNVTVHVACERARGP